MRISKGKFLPRMAFISVIFAFGTAVLTSLALFVFTGLGIAEMSDRALVALVSLTGALIHLMGKLVEQLGKGKENGT